MHHLPESVPGVADVEVIRGDRAANAVPTLLLEVPHGADRTAHYGACRALVHGPLPDDLEAFFHVNTDVGAWDLAVAIARRVVALRPDRAVLLVRSLLPRTLVDCNRAPGATDQLATGGMTPCVPSYVRDPADRDRLFALHRRWVDVVRAAHRVVVDAGGVAVEPHTYAPRSVGIDAIDDRIAARLRDAWAEPDRWPLRPEVDFITRTPDGRRPGAAALTDALIAALREAGHEVVEGGTYALVDATLGYTWAHEFEGRTTCFEVRRDLLVARWDPFAEMTCDAAAVERFAEPIARIFADRSDWISS
jgi:hypothetical protein